MMPKREFATVSSGRPRAAILGKRENAKDGLPRINGEPVGYYR
jgi:hypothetical protein